MKRPFKKNEGKDYEESSKESNLVDADYNRKKLFKKGVNLMADENWRTPQRSLSKHYELTQTVLKLF